MHFGEMAEKPVLCQMCRQSVVQHLGELWSGLLVTAGHGQWDEDELQSCPRLLLSAQEAEGCWAVTFLHSLHLEHHWRAPDFQFFPVEL